jgi:hypothetical protein
MSDAIADEIKEAIKKAVALRRMARSLWLSIMFGGGWEARRRQSIAFGYESVRL